MARDVLLRMRGLMLEKFLARALEQGVQFWDVRRVTPREASFKASEQDARTLLQLAEQYKLDVSIVQHMGMARLRQAVRARWTMPLSVCAGLLLTSLFFGRLWLIELPPDPALAQSLSAMGVQAGMPISSIDTRVIEQELYVQTGDYAFVGARIDGVRLKISAVRELPEPDIYALGEARDLVASDDCVLISIDAFSGEAVAKPGDTVRKGQLLIRGEEKVSDEATHGVCALGEAIGRSWITAESEAALTVTEQIPTGRVSLESELRLLTYAVPLLEGERFESEQTVVEQLPVGGLFLPLNIVRTRHEETRLEQKTLDAEALKQEITMLALENALVKVPSNADIVDKWVDYSMIEGGKIRARAVVEVHRNVAVGRSALSVGGN